VVLPLPTPNAERTARFRHVRRRTEALASGLSPEDCQAQSMPDASPVKWHLAHANWFFAKFVGEPAGLHVWPSATWQVLFNSYYESVGPQHRRALRGVLTRPTLAEVRAWRAQIDEQLATWSENEDAAPDLLAVLELGLHHEQQHQELILMDLLHLFAQSELQPAYRDPLPIDLAPEPPLRWVEQPGGAGEQGWSGSGFAYDNERPRHPVFVPPFALGSRLVTNREYREFLAAGGYREPTLWLSDGWDWVRRERISAPLYWIQRDGEWREMTLAGPRPLADAEPVAHVSYYEADAFARWAGARLPSEQEWERAAADLPIAGNLLDRGRLHPQRAGDGELVQMFGDLWEWTASAYAAYPGYRPAGGALGEYNAKFMVNQQVLRGGACVTPQDHLRATYRNFFPPQARWQFAGIRLCR
jgi:ergothioneine biosynthesis protein EgtB